MTLEELSRRYPLLYHMAELSCWPNIQRYGLRSTTALLDLFEITGPSRVQIESEWRRSSVSLTHPIHGAAVVRDQLPMPEDELSHHLVDMTPRQWYELINGKTFFWPEEKPLGWMLGARPYRNREHAVIVVPTQALLSHHAENATLSAINSGSLRRSTTTRSVQPRGRDTFKPILDFSARWVSELAVEYSVPNLAELAVRVEARQASRPSRVIWSRDAG